MRTLVHSKISGHGQIESYVLMDLLRLKARVYSYEQLPHTWIIRIYDRNGYFGELYDQLNEPDAKLVMNFLDSLPLEKFHHTDRYSATKLHDQMPDSRPDPGPKFIGYPMHPVSFDKSRQKNGQWKIEVFKHGKSLEVWGNLAKQHADELAEKLREIAVEKPRGRYGKKLEEK